MDDCIHRKECVDHRAAILQEVSSMIELSESKQDLELERLLNARFDKFTQEIKDMIAPIVDNQRIIYRVGIMTAIGVILVLIGVIIGRGIDFSMFF